jgi:hypothetical protein
MPKLTKESLLSAPGIFVFYCLASALVIMAFRFFFPGEEAPLAVFSLRWKLLQGVLSCISLFPGLVMSSLVIPFGFIIQPREQFTPFSPQFLDSLKLSIFTAIAGAVIYGFLFFLALPMVRDYEMNLRYEGGLYIRARDLARRYAAEEDWIEAYQFTAICEEIWPGSPELAPVRTEAAIRMDAYRLSLEDPEDQPPARRPLPGTTADLSALPGGKNPVDAAEALDLAEKALREERYYDAHWLATLGGRLAGENSPEESAAARLAGLAWNKVAAMEPGSREQEAFRLYRLKREGYEAMTARNWIQAYYIFRELHFLTPLDPDIDRFYAQSERGALESAFFTDEIEFALGEVLAGGVFSLPVTGAGSAIPPGRPRSDSPSRPASPPPQGRLVIRFSSLSVFPDYAYGIGVSLMALDREGRPGWTMEAPYAKIIPLALERSSRVAILMRALDRADKTGGREPVVTSLGETAPPGGRVLLDISWTDFLLLADIRRGISVLPVAQLRAAAEDLTYAGYLPAVFQAELLYRFSESAMLLPLAILAIVIGWRYRALKRPRYLGIPMLGVLPAVFAGFTNFIRLCINHLSIWAVLSLGYTSALILFILLGVTAFVLSLILLAAQHD